METFERSLHYVYTLKTGGLDESTDSISLLLMRSGFEFDYTNHSTLKNIKTNTGAPLALTWAASDKSVSRAAGSFIDDGFIAGNLCTSDDASNPGPLTVSTVTALKITFEEAVVDSSATKTLTSDDELEAGHGYTQGGLDSGTVTVAKNTIYNRVDSTFPPVVFTATGDSIGPTPGAIVHDVTADIIIGYLNFGEEKTAASGETITIAGGTIRGI